MLVDEVDAARCESAGDSARKFGLTNLESDLSCISNDDNHSQGNYDYDAHAHVLPGGADPLGSQGFASAVKHPSSS